MADPLTRGEIEVWRQRNAVHLRSTSEIDHAAAEIEARQIATIDERDELLRRAVKYLRKDAPLRPDILAVFGDTDD